MAFLSRFTVSERGLRAPIPHMIRSKPVGRSMFLVKAAVGWGRGEATLWIGARGEKMEIEGRGRLRVRVVGGNPMGTSILFMQKYMRKKFQKGTATKFNEQNKPKNQKPGTRVF